MGGLFLLAVTLPSLILLYNGASLGAALAAIPVSLALLLIFIAGSGSDIMDVLVNSVIFLALMGFSLPCLVHARERNADAHVALALRQLEAKQVDINAAKRQQKAHAEWLKGHAGK